MRVAYVHPVDNDLTVEEVAVVYTSLLGDTRWVVWFETIIGDDFYLPVMNKTEGDNLVNEIFTRGILDLRFRTVLMDDDSDDDSEGDEDYDDDDDEDSDDEDLDE